jgi:hypothetical protein
MQAVKWQRSQIPCPPYPANMRARQISSKIVYLNEYSAIGASFASDPPHQMSHTVSGAAGLATITH